MFLETQAGGKMKVKRILETKSENTSIAHHLTYSLIPL
jgi:hypothetical protein